MKKYEYMIVKDNLTITQMNELGAQGWELICITEDERIIFKRELA